VERKEKWRESERLEKYIKMEREYIASREKDRGKTERKS
jgi:hypothetical protein